ncbi:hypothetical protein [Asticcacaulis taihuensis]|uniref:hypothetical protein n=1 Tax=Asticcacaulis taihuensis TaxID=260084 RepID=UPI0026F0B564|nr:hypothetical protein [Asticcacaulis taihuensis]
MILTPRDHAHACGYTRKLFVSDGSTDLTIYVHPDADLDGAFVAICADDGKRFRVNGWMMSECEDINEGEAN